jgi:hypothetical protein
MKMRQKMVKLVAIERNSDVFKGNEVNYLLCEVWVNPLFVISATEDFSMKTELKNGRMPKELMLEHKFTRLSVSNGNFSQHYIVVGAPDSVNEKLFNNRNAVLHG